MKKYFCLFLLIMLSVFTFNARAQQYSKNSDSSIVAFKAQLMHNGLNLLGPADIIFDSVIFNNGNAYDNHTGYFIAPSAGFYEFHVQLVWFATEKPKTVGFKIVKNKTSREDVENWTEISPTLNGGTFTQTSALMNLATGDTIRVNAGAGSGGTTTIAPYMGDSHFYGYKFY
jgi:hypothetical protein